jgi:predicted MFS family arabinose efflux permease
MNKKERMILWILAGLNFTHILDFMIMMPLGNFLMPHFNISAQFFSWIVAAYPMTAFFSGMVTAFYVDRFDRKRVLLMAYAGFLIGTLCCGLAPDPYFLMAARILTGLFGGLIGAQVLSIVADTFPYEKRGRAMGTIFMAFSIASVFGVHLQPAEERVRSRPNVIKVFRDVFNNKAQVMALLLSGGLMMGHFLIIPFVNPYMEFNVGFTKTQTPLIYMVGGLCAMVTSPIIGRMSDRYGKFKIFVVCLFCSLIPIFLITNMPPIPFYYVLIVMGFWFTFSTGRNIPAQAMITTVVNPAERGQFMSFNSSFQQLFTGMASLIAGMIVVSDAGGKIHHYNWVGYLSIAIVLSTVFIAKRLANQQQLS